VVVTPDNGRHGRWFPAHELGDFSGLLVGSTGVQVATHAPCPVIVVRPVSAEPPNSMAADQVVGGVNGSPLSVAAIEVGFAEAVQPGVGVVAVHVAASRVPGDSSVDVLTEEHAPEQTRLLAESLAGWQEKYPDMPIRRVVLRMHCRVLTWQSRLIEAVPPLPQRTRHRRGLSRQEGRLGYGPAWNR
jgi:nucleotide-binding universal stress UspA family protein